MRPRAMFAAIVLSVAPLVCLAGEEAGQPQLSCIKDITYSHEFLAKYPKAGAACREVAMKDGTKWVRFEAEVTRIKGNQLTANFLDKYENSVAKLTFQADPSATLEVDGKEIPYKRLRGGDHLSVWMPESKVGFYSAPGSLHNQQLSLVRDESAQR